MIKAQCICLGYHGRDKRPRPRYFHAMDRQAVVGKKFAPHSHKVTQEEAWAYALATNDPNPRYQSEQAPPMFAVFLQMPVMFEALKDEAVIVDPARFLRLLHGEHDLRWHRALLPGHTYQTHASVSRITAKPSGEIIDLHFETREDDALVVEGAASLFIRGESNATHSKPTEPSVPRAEPQHTLVFSEREHVAANQSVRYAQASGDHNPIHTDPAVAQKAGLPGIILHGLCTMAFCQKTLVNTLCKNDPNKLERLKVRFAKPVLMEQDLNIAGWQVEPHAFAFDVRANGAVVLKDGLATLRA